MRKMKKMCSLKNNGKICFFRNLKIKIEFDRTYPISGVGNSFGFAGHIREKLGVPGPVHAPVN